MPHAWIERRPGASGVRHRVRYRLGGREAQARYAGSFRTRREAELRLRWVRAELAAMRVPDLRLLIPPEPTPTLKAIARRWQDSRTDVRDATAIQHRTSLHHVNRLLGDRAVDAITRQDVQDMVDVLVGEGRARESVRKCRTALAMVLDYADVSPNPARDRRVKLPLEEPEEVTPPHADHVEAVGWLLAPRYVLALLILDATGCRVGELHAATVGDLDEARRAWLVRARIAKTRRPRWVVLPDDLYRTAINLLPARGDREPEAQLFNFGTTDALRVAIARACRDAGVPVFSPHDLRHRRISLLHHQGESWAEIGARVGQRNLSTTADTYTHVLMDYREIDRTKLLARVRIEHPPVPPSSTHNPSVAGAS